MIIYRIYWILYQCCALSTAGTIVKEVICELLDQVRYYIRSAGMPIDTGHSRIGLTPLMAASKYNYPKYLQYFRQLQANDHIRDVQGYIACRWHLCANSIIQWSTTAVQAFP